MYQVTMPDRPFFGAKAATQTGPQRIRLLKEDYKLPLQKRFITVKTQSTQGRILT